MQGSSRHRLAIFSLRESRTGCERCRRPITGHFYHHGSLILAISYPLPATGGHRGATLLSVHESAWCPCGPYAAFWGMSNELWTGTYHGSRQAGSNSANRFPGVTSAFPVSRPESIDRYPNGVIARLMEFIAGLCYFSRRRESKIRSVAGASGSAPKTIDCMPRSLSFTM